MQTQVQSGIGETREIARVRAGDREALSSFIRRHGPPVRALAIRFLRRERDRNAVLEETFRRAIEAIESWDDAGDIAPRLRRWALEACLRRLELAPHGPAADVESLLPGFDETGHRIPVTHGRAPLPPTPENVRACIDRLPGAYRTALLLHDVEGLEPAETAWLLRRPEAEIPRLVHAARQAVQGMLAGG